MSVRQLMDELEKLGVRLWEESGRLRFRAPKGVLTDERISALRAGKAEILAALRQDDVVTVTPDAKARYEPFPLTDVQAAYLLGRHDSFGYGGVACHIYLELGYPELAPARLERAWNTLILRHDMLRAVIHPDGYQRIEQEVPHYRIAVSDLRGELPAAVTTTLEALRAKVGHAVYEAGSWPMFDLRVTLTDDKAILHFSLDFMIADWASIQLLLTQLDRAYRDPDDEPTQPEITFRDYVTAERALRDTRRYERDRAYWTERVDSLPSAPELPVLDADPAGRPRFRRRELRLDARLWSGLTQRARTAGITPTCAVLSAYAEVLGRWSRRPAFTLNLTLLNRLPLHPDVGALVGDFTSVTLLAVDPEPGAGFRDRAATLGRQLFDDMDHRLCSGIEVIREIARRRGRDEAMMPVVFTSAIGLSGEQGAGEPARAGEFGFGITQTPQVWIDCQALDRDGELIVNWDVRDDVFPDGMVDDMFTAFETLLRGLATTDETWHEPDPVALPAYQLERRRAVNDTAGPLPDVLLHEPVLDQARRTPDRVAVIDGTQHLSYAELAARSAAVAAALEGNGLRPGELVAVVLDKGAEQVVAVLGVLRAGGAYLPLDTNQPALRREAILRDAGVRIVLTHSTAAEPLPPWPDDVTAIGLDTLPPLPPAEAEPLARRVGPDDLAYVIYTSGSTGQPKGVLVSHRAAANTVADINRRFDVTGDDRVLGLANLGFDLSVYDIFGPLALGGRVVLPDPQRRGDPSHWAELVAEHDVTMWNSVPAQLQMLYQYLETEPELKLPVLRLALLSGDWIPVSLPDQVRARIPGLRVISLGGATEAAIWSIYYPIDEVDPGWRSIPYGYPLTNQTFHVLDPALHDCPAWTVGELYIGGAGLAKGYLGDEERTAQRFIVHPRTGQRLYRTGDHGRYLPDGAIEFLGRQDQQIKIRGHRIELAEVETAVQSFTGAAAAAVIVNGADPLHRRLVAFVEPTEPGALVPTQLDEHLAARLPEYMQPAVVHVLDALPLTENGKVDRRALATKLAELRESADGPGTDEPATPLERALAQLWAEVLGVPRVGREDDFFALGGNSLLATTLVGQLRERIPEASGLFFDSLVRQLLPEPTVAALARHLATRTAVAQPGQDRRVVSPLVRFGAGEVEPTVVLVHDGTGGLASYRALAQKLDPSRAVAGLKVNQPEPYLRLGPAALVPRRAEAYARLLRAEELARVRVVGYGAAAAIAFDLSRGLVEAGVEVDTLFLIDGYRLRGGFDDELLVERLFATELGVDPASLGYPADVAAERGDRLAAIREAAGDAVSDEISVRSQVFRHTLEATADYQPEPYLGEVVLYESDRFALSPDHVEAATATFGDLCLGGLTVYDAPSDGPQAPIALAAALSDLSDGARTPR